MPTPPPRETPFYLRTPPQDVRVTSWPLRDDPWRSLPMVVLGLSAAVAAGVLSRNPWAAVLAVAAVTISLWRTWLPVVYEFDPRGVTQMALGRRRLFSWLSFGNYRFTPRGVVLFPPGEPNWWNAAGALFILWSGKKKAITEITEYYLGSRLVLEESSRAQTQSTVIRQQAQRS